MKEELIVSVNGSTTHNNTSVWEFCDSTARVLVLEITQLAKDTISQINDTPSFKQHPQRAHKSAYEQPYQHWQSLAEFTRYTFFLPPPPRHEILSVQRFPKLLIRSLSYVRRVSRKWKSMLQTGNYLMMGLKPVFSQEHTYY